MFWLEGVLEIIRGSGSKGFCCGIMQGSRKYGFGLTPQIPLSQNLRVIKEGFLKLYQNQGTGQEVAVLGEGTKMTTDTVITGGEVAVGVGIGMTVTDTMVRTETTVDEAGAVVPYRTCRSRSRSPYRSQSQSPYRSRSRSPYRTCRSL
ncbi:hypothetical protein C1H46_020516 [Malus baccata]|uniref:Uncharacterized protein n=1 Tax=Malus baccata TaxID=106549 RepID=A0A540M555_MALBA|nr:hypothetical protein C1H46_020516 [Malus baccata]